MRLANAAFEPAFFEVTHVFKNDIVFVDENDFEKVADDERRDEDFLPFYVRPDVVDAIGDMRTSYDDVWNGRSLGITQELDMFGVIVRIGHPDAALFDPILIGLRNCGGDPDVIKHKHRRVSQKSGRGMAARNAAIPCSFKS
jgi:hypothetical protein